MTLTDWAALAMIALQVADVVTTIGALDRPGVREANPVIRWLMDRLGRAWWAPKIALAAAVTYGLWAADAGVALALVGAVYAVIVAQNYKLGRN